MSSQELFFEIGVEELPANVVMDALRQLSEGLLSQLDGALISHGAMHTFATPRRLGVVFEDVATTGQDCHREEFGPPVKVAFDDEGNPRVPAQKFAEKVGKTVAELERKEKDGKGEYLVAQVVDPGVDTVAFVGKTLPELLRGIHFAKSMRWGSEKQAFSRPVHWLCVKLGDQVVPTEFAGITSSNTSRGHRFLAPDTFEVGSYSDFKETCRAKYVIIDPEERKAIIHEGADKVAATVGGTYWKDEELLDLNVQLSEYPVPLLAEYEARYLSLPQELLKTSMRNHLKCFAVVDAEGKLLPYFVPVAGLPSTNEDKVRNGFQRVLRARLADAEFFYENDRSQSLEALAPKLDKVIYQNDLGTYGDKVRRVMAQVEGIAEEIGYPDAKADSLRAAALYKADLNSDMVYEFPELQGIMGRDYALHSGEPQAVADAILEHYLPAGADDDPPDTPAGQALAIAERLDTLVGGFGVGLRPTGSTDPYGLRRQAITMLRILREHKLPGRLSALLELAAAPLGERIGDTNAVRTEVLGYLRDRLPQMFAEDGWDRDLIAAVCVNDLIGRFPLYQLNQLFESLQKALQSGTLAGLAYSFKRVSNILKQGVKLADAKDELLADLSDEQRAHIGSYGGLGTLTFNEGPPTINTDLLKESQEQALYELVSQLQSTIDQRLADAQFGEAFEALLQLREPIDALFDNVMVMTKEDKALLVNRLALLRGVARLAFIDFGTIDTSEMERS
jgi:glycyl-tRNA synthetase beta chain